MMIIIAVLGILVFVSLLVLVWLFFKSCVKGKKGAHKNETPLGDLKIINIDPPDSKNTRQLRLRNFSSGGSGAMMPLLPGGSIRSNSESRAMYGDLDGECLVLLSLFFVVVMLLTFMLDEDVENNPRISGV